MNSNTATASATDLSQLSREELLAKVAELTKAATRAATKGTVCENGLSLRVGDKGGISIYGVGRFPVSLYRSQVEKVIQIVKNGELEAFIIANTSKLATKPVKE